AAAENLANTKCEGFAVGHDQPGNIFVAGPPIDTLMVTAESFILPSSPRVGHFPFPFFLGSVLGSDDAKCCGKSDCAKAPAISLALVWEIWEVKEMAGIYPRWRCALLKCHRPKCQRADGGRSARGLNHGSGQKFRFFSALHK